MKDSDGQEFRRRSGWVITWVLVWGILCIVHLFYYSVIKQESLQKKARETAWRIGELPAVRGAILASDGTVLASSALEFYLSLSMNEINARQDVEKVLKRKVEGREKITDEELLHLEPLVRKYPSAIKITSRERRNSPPEMQKFEKKYETSLQGKKGFFIIMLDRFGNRVPGTLKIIREQIPGQNVILSQKEEKDL